MQNYSFAVFSLMQAPIDTIGSTSYNMYKFKKFTYFAIIANNSSINQLSPKRCFSKFLFHFLLEIAHSFSDLSDRKESSYRASAALFSRNIRLMPKISLWTVLYFFSLTVPYPSGILFLSRDMSIYRLFFALPPGIPNLPSVFVLPCLSYAGRFPACASL